MFIENKNNIYEYRLWINEVSTYEKDLGIEISNSNAMECVTMELLRKGSPRHYYGMIGLENKKKLDSGDGIEVIMLKNTIAENKVYVNGTLASKCDKVYNGLYNKWEQPMIKAIKEIYKDNGVSDTKLVVKIIMSGEIGSSMLIYKYILYCLAGIMKYIKGENIEPNAIDKKISDVLSNKNIR